MRIGFYKSNTLIYLESLESIVRLLSFSAMPPAFSPISSFFLSAKRNGQNELRSNVIEKGLEGSIYETIDSYYWIDDDFFSISVVVLVKVAKLLFLCHF